MSDGFFDFSEGDLSELIKKFSSTFTKDKVLKNSSSITQSISMNTKIEEGGLEVIENNGTSTNAVIYKDGKQLVTRGGTTISTQIDGGSQFVFDESPGNIGRTGRKSRAYDTVVFGTNGNIGQQNIYDGGEAWNTKIKRNGMQHLYKGKTTKGGTASNTEVSSNGKQLVLAGGEALNVILKEKALQVVYPGGRVKNLTIQDQAQSWIHVGASLTGPVKVNEQGHLYLYAGDNISHVTKEEITLEGRSSEKLFSVGAQNRSQSSEIDIEDLSGNGGTIVFSYVGYDKRHSKLNVGKLSGGMHFKFNVSDVGRGNDYIVIKDGSGTHTISVTDSGSEIANYFLQKYGRVSELNLVTDTSVNGGATFTLADSSSGRSIGAVDAGVYMYTLQKREKSGNLKTWFLSSNSNQSRQISSPSKRFIEKKLFVDFLSTSSNSMGNGKQNNGKSRGQKSQTSRKNSESRPRPPRHLQRSAASSSAFDLRETQNDETQSSHEPKSRRRFLSSNDIVVENYPILDGSPVVELDGSSVLDLEQSQIPDFEVVQYIQEPQIDDSVIAGDKEEDSVLDLIKPVYPEDNENTDLEDQESSSEFVNHDDEEQFPVFNPISEVVSAPFTTPSTDALLSLAVAPGLIFNNELQSLRAGRGFIEKNKKNIALWTYGIKSKEHLATDHTHFKLDQTGIMVGIDWLSDLVNGQFYIGGFGSYDQSNISHARGGVSHVNICSVGTYAAYFGDRGWYLDSILKYNHYQNNLQAVSTNGLNIKGDYNQKAIGASFEAGRRIKLAQDSWTQPYAQLIWLRVEGKEIKLSNEMIGDIDPYTSLRSEIGLSIGHEFNLGTPTQLMTYTKAAWLREYIDNNHTTINKQHKFNTDLSGNAGKFGIGLNGFVSENLNLYAEAHYLKGKKTKRSLQGIVGLRYSF
ncbi:MULTISPECIES: BafA family autotransporter [unclassified Bartonella]|uniref:BafA family autotransporter n=1 Tax=unclassified Bartonella TaxID=2645622 RepID=UPI0018862112|nr:MULTISPECIES: BafA family autotransporter [unclassified Bartonella]